MIIGDRGLLGNVSLRGFGVILCYITKGCLDIDKL